MDLSLALRVAAVFIILVISMIGICFPLLVSTDNNLFRVLNAGSAGVMLGLALVSAFILIVDCKLICNFCLFSFTYFLMRTRF